MNLSCSPNIPKFHTPATPEDTPKQAHLFKFSGSPALKWSPAASPYPSRSSCSGCQEGEQGRASRTLSQLPRVLPSLKASLTSSPIPAPSLRLGVLERKPKRRPYPLFSRQYVEDLAAPQRQHLWPRLNWGAGEAELRRGEMCGGLPFLPSSSPSRFRLPNWGPGQATLIGWGTGSRLPLSRGQGSSPRSIRMV